MPVNVKNYGAVGDGTTDDLGAIQSAIDDASAAGGTVFFPAGRYAVSDTITVAASNVVLAGEGGGSQLVRLRSSDTHTIVAIYGPQGRRSGYIRRCGLHDLAIGNNVVGGPEIEDPAPGDTAVLLHKTIEFHVSNCAIEQANSPGLTLIDAYIGDITYCQLRQNTDAVVFVGCSNAIRLIGNRIQSNSGVGITAPKDEVSPNEFAAQFKGILIAGNDIEGNGSYGILFENSIYDGIMISGNYFEANFAPKFSEVRGPHIYKPAMGQTWKNTFRGITIAGNQLAIRPLDLTQPEPTIVIEEGSEISVVGNSSITYGSSDPDVRFRDTVHLGPGVTSSFISGLRDQAALSVGDVEVRAGSGVVLSSPDGSRHRITVADDGSLSTTRL
ncbi:glycosyl hydrolase family 28-related protein [Propionibacteriaceae bacterium Y2011]|uniref:glycosyl hydrolase family 28-related protein n=1 Tax=Microlunatus sp. Y2014 TaxID=3418488 RepID=UPI003B4B37AD